MIMFYGIGWGKVLTSVGWIFVFVLGISRVSNWIYAYIFVGSYFFKNQDPPSYLSFSEN
jgi:hypothetical protein